MGAFLLILGLGIALIAAGQIYRTVRAPKGGPPRCGKCGYEVAPNPAGLTRCPECGGEYLQVGIITPASRGEQPSTPSSTAGALASVILVLAALIYLPIQAGWPTTSRHIRGNSLYTPTMGQRSSPTPRKVAFDMDIEFVEGRRALDGWLDLSVTNPATVTVALRLDAATGSVLYADKASGIQPGSALSTADVRALYNAAGFDTTADPHLAAEADAVQAEVLAEIASPSIANGGPISIGGQLPALARTGGGFTGFGGSAIILLGSHHIPLLLVYLLVVVAFYGFVARVALRVRRDSVAKPPTT